MDLATIIVGILLLAAAGAVLRFALALAEIALRLWTAWLRHRTRRMNEQAARQRNLPEDTERRAAHRP